MITWTCRDSPPVPLPRERCPSGKLGWFSEADARAAMQRAQSRRRRPGERVPRSVYLCREDDCGSWHLTGRLQGERGDV